MSSRSSMQPLSPAYTRAVSSHEHLWPPKAHHMALAQEGPLAEIPWGSRLDVPPWGLQEGSA